MRNTAGPLAVPSAPRPISAGRAWVPPTAALRSAVSRAAIWTTILPSRSASRSRHVR